MDMTIKGRVWKFDHNIDTDVMAPWKSLGQPWEERRKVILHNRPGFSDRVQPGDIIVAGKRFAQGNPHIYGLIGIRALGLGLVVESIPRGSFRNAINAALPFLPRCPGVTSAVDQGDEVEVDFRNGTFTNLTRGTAREYTPLDSTLLRIIEAGGWEAKLRHRIAEMKAPDR